ncbi:MAG: AN1-type zinc finger domain-containing protein [Candidatus Lokiarchaeia archaeon]
MVKCEFCGKGEYLPFKCRYCSGYFCIDHRLPENHNCSSALQISEKKNNLMKSAKSVKMEDNSKRKGIEKDLVPRRTIYDRSIIKLGKISTSKREIAHLFIATFIILVVVFSSLMYNLIWLFINGLGDLVFGTLIWMVFNGLSGFVSYIPWLSNFLLVFQIDNALWLGLIVVASFLLHEFAHKFVAQIYNLWAEFRLILSGALITLVSILSPLKFLVPGAVMISGPTDWHTVGKTSLSGPLVNLILGSILFGLTFIFQDVGVQSLFSQVNLYQILLIGASINADLGIFNMLPFGPFDGLKVMKWSFPIWLAVFSLLLIFRVVLFSIFYW